MSNISSTPPSTLKLARQIAMNNGIRYAYTGNVHDSDGDSTYCHACGDRLIERDWYVLGEWSLDEYGRCQSCGEQCAGVFEATHGNWGAKRQPVRLSSVISQR